MVFVWDVIEALQTIAPSEYALPGDKIGLQVGDSSAPVARALVSLDRSAAAIQACIDMEGELLLCHHPIIWEPLASVTDETEAGGCILVLLREEINLIAAHTNWDCARGGVNDALAVKLGLVDVTPFGSAATYPALKVVTFCPADSVEQILDAATGAGAGEIGDYRRCAFTQAGEGTFDAPEGSAPAAGTAGKRNRVAEVRIEMELRSDRRAKVEKALRLAHPYEVPVVDFLAIQKTGLPIGRVGGLTKPLSIAEFRDLLDSALGTRTQAWSRAGDGEIEWVGVVGGAADDEWKAAKAAGCHAFVTGEVKQHNAVEGSGCGINMFAAGHYATEQPGVEALAARMREAVPDVEWNLFVPNPGKGGRPL